MSGRLRIVIATLAASCMGRTVVAQTPQPAAPASIPEKIDAFMAEWDRPDAPGAAIAVVRGGEIVYSAGFGSAQLEYQIPITPATVFHIASISKQFTAFSIVLLAQRGELSLDDDIRTYIPEVPDFGHTITLRQLIHHTSGLRDQWNLLGLAGWRLDDLEDEMLAAMPPVEPTAEGAGGPDGAASPPAVAVAPETIDDYPGDYHMSVGIVVEIKRDGDGLTGQVRGQAQSFPLDPDGEDAFTVAAASARLEFGRYDSPELGTFYEIVAEEGTLIARHRRHGDFDLVATRPDVFRATRWYFQRAEFERDDDGNVIAMLVSSGRVRAVRFDRR